MPAVVLLFALSLLLFRSVSHQFRNRRAPQPKMANHRDTTENGKSSRPKMANHRCEECGVDLDPAKLLRCTKCKACCYCSKACQTRNWRQIHKRVCTTDSALRPFVPVEMAVERALAKQRPMEKAPKDAFCYICLDGDDGGKLLRGCACRGDSAGFVHLECLTKHAVSKEEEVSGDDTKAGYNGWRQCVNCRQCFRGALALEMARRCWRQQRWSQDLGQRYTAVKYVAACLEVNGEVDAAKQLLDGVSKKSTGYDRKTLLEMQYDRAEALSYGGRELEALELLKAMLPEAEACAAWGLYVGGTTLLVDVLLRLDRNQEAYDLAVVLVAATKEMFHDREEGTETLVPRKLYAIACVRLGRVQECKALVDDLLSDYTRIYGPDHMFTQGNRQLLGPIQSILAEIAAHGGVQQTKHASPSTQSV